MAKGIVLCYAITELVNNINILDGNIKLKRHIMVLVTA